jgi:hypothetical protein
VHVEAAVGLVECQSAKIRPQIKSRVGELIAIFEFSAEKYRREMEAILDEE